MNNQSVITIGTFDGVHLGHQFLLKETVRIAHELSAKSSVITYQRHPIEITNDKIFPYLLTEPQKREELIKQIGIQDIYYLNFTKEMSKMRAIDFLRDILVGKYNPLAIVIGYDTHFGVDREGNADLLEKNQNILNYQLIKIQPYIIDDRPISSTFIRNLIRYGEVDMINKYLGYNYSIQGVVVQGKKIGRSINIPTINLEPNEPNKLIPAGGVYSTNIKINNSLYSGITNIGYAPTIKNESKFTIETHILDFEDIIYGKNIELFFIKKIRDEIKFGSLQELKKQIEIDIEKVKKEFI